MTTQRADDAADFLRDLGYLVIPPGEEKRDPASGVFPLERGDEACTLRLEEAEAEPLSPREALVLAGLTEPPRLAEERVQGSWARGDERDTCVHVRRSADLTIEVFSAEPACYRVDPIDLGPCALSVALVSATRAGASAADLDAVDVDDVRFFAELHRRERASGRRELPDDGSFWTSQTARPKS